MHPQTNPSPPSIRVPPAGVAKVWAQCVDRMDRHLAAAVGLPVISFARSDEASGLLEAVLDQLLAGVDPHIVFLPNGLLAELKTKSVGRVLGAVTDGDNDGDATGSFQTRVVTAAPA
jgi:hypothetical protein